MQSKVRAAIHLATLAGAAGAAIAQDARVLHVSPAPEMIVPTRYAPVALVDGQARIAGEWRDFTAPDAATREGTRGCERLWDAFQPHPCTGVPIGGRECGVCDGCRWYWGDTFNNPFSADDMTMDKGYEGSLATRAGFAWWWGEQSLCYVGVLTSDDHLTWAGCETIEWADGWVFEFPNLKVGAWATNIDLGDGGPDGWRMPADSKGSNAYFLSDFFDGEFFCLAEFGCHFLLWGTSDAGGIPDRPGSTDWQVQDGEQGGCGVPFEGQCFWYSGPCPDPLTNMIVFWGVPGDPLPCFVDCNGDRVLDTRDLFCFLNLYAAGDAAADCNGDTVINSLDVTCFLNLFRYPPCP